MSIAELFASEFLGRIVIRALIVGILVSICSSLLGVSLVLKRYSMIGDGLSHVGFFGLALASCAGVSASYSMEISIPVVIIAAVLILRLSKNDKKMSGDAACALISTGSVAIGTLMYNFTGGRASDICSSLFGSASIITISEKDMVISIILSIAVLVWFITSFKTIFSVTFDETFAGSVGVKTDLFGLLLSILTGITIVVGMKMMGSIMISAMIIFPALTAMKLTKSFKFTVILSAALSVVCFIFGFFIACFFSLQTGAAVVTTELVVFSTVSLIRFIKSKVKQH